MSPFVLKQPSLPLTSRGWDSPQQPPLPPYAHTPWVTSQLLYPSRDRGLLLGSPRAHRAGFTPSAFANPESQHPSPSEGPAAAVGR